MVYKVRDKKTGPGASSRVGAYVNKVLAQDLHKKVIKKFKTSFNHDIRYLLCVIYVFTKYASIKPGKDKKKAKTDLHGFIRTRNQSRRKPNQLWVD